MRAAHGAAGTAQPRLCACEASPHLHPSVGPHTDCQHVAGLLVPPQTNARHRSSVAFEALASRPCLSTSPASQPAVDIGQCCAPAIGQVTCRPPSLPPTRRLSLSRRLLCPHPTPSQPVNTTAGAVIPCCPRFLVCTIPVLLRPSACCYAHSAKCLCCPV